METAASSLRRVLLRRGVGLFLLLAAVGMQGESRAQSASVGGFVTDRATGQALTGANVVLQHLADSTVAGATTNENGVYLVSALEPGRYGVRVSFVGFRSYTDTLQLDADVRRTLNVELAPGEVGLEEITVEEERGEGAARPEAGRQIIRPEDIERVPTPDVSGDLASYLTTLPGVVALGDRGGQLFIRGGEPSQNLIFLDGMTLYRPFHVIGFYSVFPSDIVRRADLYAGGFGAQYGERIGSVLNVQSRTGNKRSFAGAVSASPFMGSVRLEGPLVPGRISFLASVRQSLLEGAEYVIDENLPFRFGDAFAKVHAAMTPRNRFSVSALSTYDRGTLREAAAGGPPAEEVRWQNQSVGLRWLSLPPLFPASTDLHLSFSHHRTEMGPVGQPVRSSSVTDLHALFDATYFGEKAHFDIGMAARYVWLKNSLGGLYQNVVTEDTEFPPFALYVVPEITQGAWRIRPSLRMQIYNVKVNPTFEPRLRVIWQKGRHQVSGAAGLYHQEVTGLNDRRDAASIFTAWSNVPRYLNIRYVDFPGLPSSPRNEDIRAGFEHRALHGILGYQVSPASWLDLSLEGFYRRYDNLFIAEWSALPQFTTELQRADGRSLGLDARLEVQRDPFYLFVGYGLSTTQYAAKQAALELWYGTETLEFRPAHDRRHQLSVLGQASWQGFDLSLRWSFGSGRPFSRPVGFDGFSLIDEVEDVRKQPSTRRVIYEAPFNDVLPPYHRLDVSLARRFSLQAVDLTVQASVINAYDRRNIFYMDTFTFQRVDQLPLVPSLGLQVAFGE